MAKNVKIEGCSNFDQVLIQDAVDYEQTSFTPRCGRHESTYWPSNNDHRQVWFQSSDFLETNFAQFCGTTNRTGAIFFLEKYFLLIFFAFRCQGFRKFSHHFCEFSFSIKNIFFHFLEQMWARFTVVELMNIFPWSGPS